MPWARSRSLGTQSVHAWVVLDSGSRLRFGQQNRGLCPPHATILSIHTSAPGSPPPAHYSFATGALSPQPCCRRLSHNGIGHTGAAALADAIANLHALNCLDLW